MESSCPWEERELVSKTLPRLTTGKSGTLKEVRRLNEGERKVLTRKRRPNINVLFWEPKEERFSSLIKSLLRARHCAGSMLIHEEVIILMRILKCPFGFSNWIYTGLVSGGMGKGQGRMPQINCQMIKYSYINTYIVIHHINKGLNPYDHLKSCRKITKFSINAG